MFRSIEFISKVQEITVVEDDGRRHCDTIRPDLPPARLMLLLHCRSVRQFHVQSEAVFQMISSIPKRPSSDIYPSALSFYSLDCKEGLAKKMFVCVCVCVCLSVCGVQKNILAVQKTNFRAKTYRGVFRGVDHESEVHSPQNPIGR